MLKTLAIYLAAYTIGVATALMGVAFFGPAALVAVVLVAIFGVLLVAVGVWLATVLRDG